MNKVLLYVMAVLYVAAGVNHFWHVQEYENIMPPYLPWHTALIYISGALEIVLGLLLIPAPTRRFAALGIIVLLVAIFPANVQMAVNFAHVHNPYLWITIVRLPLQVLLIWIAWRYYMARPARRAVV